MLLQLPSKRPLTMDIAKKPAVCVGSRFNDLTNNDLRNFFLFLVIGNLDNKKSNWALKLVFIESQQNQSVQLFLEEKYYIGIEFSLQAQTFLRSKEKMWIKWFVGLIGNDVHMKIELQICENVQNHSNCLRVLTFRLHQPAKPSYT